MTAYVTHPGAPARPEHLEIPKDQQPQQPQQVHQVEIPTEIIAPAPTAPSTVLTPEATSSTPPTTPGTPPVVPTTSAPPSSKFTITISISEFRGDSWFPIGVSADSCPTGVP